MNNSIAAFVSEVNIRTARRRRMMSLLLGLSMVVTSGVSWALHGVGLTLANEAECGIEEHIHTDACYEQQLLCGLQEDDAHQHDESCFRQTLVCDVPEHIHDAACYLGGGEDSDSEETRTEAPEEVPEQDDDSVVIGGVTDAEGNPLKPVIGPRKAVRAPDGQSIPLDTVETIDNIAEGIRFTLFDYGGSELESQNNNYGYSYYDGAYHHDSVRDSGINTGRNVNDDIMFFAYGTPVPDGARDGDNWYNYKQDGVQYYKPDKNSYSGDYYATPAYPGNRPVTGIVGNTLGPDGYPYVVGSNNSLAYLFAPDTFDEERNVDQKDYKTVYTDVNHLLQRQDKDGHLVYNSNENYAYFNQDTKEFDVYNQTFEIINDDHHLAGDENNIKFNSDGSPVVYDSDVNPGFKIGFFPFDAFDETRKDPNYNGNGYNHHFGMTMDAKFANPEYDGTNVTEPITFKYSGDDDMWVFVDGKLVLDLGGIHEPAGGMIDFSNGLVWTQDNGNAGRTKEQWRSQLESWGIVHNDAEWNALPELTIGIDTSGAENKWIVRRISDLIPGWDATAHTENHQINMFYLERGGCYSNLAMEMNLPTLKPLTVMKNVDYQKHLVKGLYENQQYEFQVYEWDKTNGQWVETQETNSKGKFYLPGGHFYLKDGERKTFENLGQDRKLRVVEKGIDPNVIGQVKVNGAVTGIEGGSVTPEGGLLKDLNSYSFENQIIEEVKPVTVKKMWAPENVQPPPGFDKVKFKIMRTDSVNGEIKQVAVQQGDIKVRTFVISAAEWAEGVTINGLLSRYGDHQYTYEVEELNVPTGFKPSYGKDASGALVITNTDVSKTDLYVEKQWEHTENPPKIKLLLTRSRVEYEPSAPTTLTVNITDEAGNLIKTYTTPQYTAGAMYHGVYSDGSVELSYAIPKGAVLCPEDETNPQKNPSSIGVKFHPDEGILVVDHLSADPNTVTFKVNTANAEDSLLLLHHSFSDTKFNWTVQNDPSKGTHAEATLDQTASYGKQGGSLLISDRTKAFNGAVLPLDPAKFHGNKTYTFSTYVYSPVADRFKMTFNNGLGGYVPIGNEVNVPANTWTQVTGRAQLTGEIDPYNMFVLVETSATDNNESCAGSWFRIDEFTAVEDNTPVSVSADGGVVTVGSPAGEPELVYSIDFKNGLTDGWSKMNNPQVSGGSDFVRVYQRNGSGDGIQRSVASLLKPGHTYRFEAGGQHDGNNAAGNLHLVLNYGNNYNWLCQMDLPDSSNDHYQWASATQEFTVPADANLSNAKVYFETNNDNRSYRVRYLRIYDLTPDSSSQSGDLTDQPGYDETTGQYVSDFSNYRIVPDENSITAPPRLKSDRYDPEDGWERAIILPDDSEDGASWSYHWDNDLSRLTADPNDPHYIYEDHQHYLYKYHIEELWIDSEGNVINESDGKWLSDDGNYLVSYLSNDVATNDPDNPIIVKNAYIWYRLPETGGVGTDTIYGAGLFLITTGLIGGYAFRRRERRFR